MSETRIATVRVWSNENRIDVRLLPGFGAEELAVVRALPGRRWDAERRVWSAPDAEAALAALRSAWGDEGFSVEREEGRPPGSEGEGLLDQVQDALVLRGYSPRTRSVYLGHLRRFLEWAGGGGTVMPDELVRRAHEYILHLVHQRRISRSYQNQVVSAIRFLCESVLEQPRLALRIPRPRKERRLPAVLSQREVARMLAGVRNVKHRALLVLLYSAGLRVGELVRLRPEDLDMDRGLLLVRKGKGGKDRYTLLARKAIGAVRSYRAAYPVGPWLFPGGRPGRHLTTRSVQRVVQRCAERAGIDKRVTAHTLRHSFATHLLEGGTNLRIIQELLGHRSARTTQIYTHVAHSRLGSVRSPADDLPLLDPDP